MKKAVVFSSMLTCLIFTAVQLFSQKVNPPLITYNESSVGLAIPEWEGGRSELEFADMNGDGNLDIITIGDHGNPGIQSGEQGLMVYFGDGQGNWTVQMGGDFGYGGIAAGDVNNDGFMDVGYAMHHNYSATDFGDQLIEVALGDGTGTNWTPWDDGLATNGEDWGMFATDFADIDNDGDLDLGCVSFGCCSGIHIYLNNQDGTWTQSFAVLEGNSDMIFQFGELDGDGFMDFIAGHESGTAYFGDGSGYFMLRDNGLPAAGTLGRYGPSLGDVNKDGAMDLAFTDSNGGLHVYYFNLMVASWQSLTGNLPASGLFEHTQLADMDMDGFVDLAAYGAGTFQLFLRDINTGWITDATFVTGYPGSSQAFRAGGDVDHNGRPDIVLLEEEEISWWTYQNHLKCFRESSEPVQLEIKAVYPRGWERFRPGSVRFIEWISAVPGNEPAEVKLEFSATGPDGPMTLIAEGLPDNGRYQWTVPQVSSLDCFIRYTITSGLSTYSSVTPWKFHIFGPVGVAEQQPENFEITVYPNPAGRQIAVSNQRSAVGSQQLAVSGRRSAVGSRQLAVRLEIVDLYGREMKRFSDVNFPFMIDISDLPNGMYIIKMASEDGMTGSEKFLKLN